MHHRKFFTEKRTKPGSLVHRETHLPARWCSMARTASSAMEVQQLLVLHGLRPARRRGGARLLGHLHGVARIGPKGVAEHRCSMVYLSHLLLSTFDLIGTSLGPLGTCELYLNVRHFQGSSTMVFHSNSCWALNKGPHHWECTILSRSCPEKRSCLPDKGRPYVA